MISIVRTAELPCAIKRPRPLGYQRSFLVNPAGECRVSNTFLGAPHIRVPCECVGVRTTLLFPKIGSNISRRTISMRGEFRGLVQQAVSAGAPLPTCTHILVAAPTETTLSLGRTRIEHAHRNRTCGGDLPVSREVHGRRTTRGRQPGLARPRW